jgi:GntR family transcriptional regulator, transcriptional repressor for pyruvate dehydrogenase complex
MVTKQPNRSAARAKSGGVTSTLQPTVMHTIAALRKDARATREGVLVGSEEELLARYGVSRPTLRQAAAIVSQEQLLKIQRGVGGGYIATRPQFTAVAHMAAIFLQTRGTKLQEILRAIEPIRIELVRQATMHLDETVRAEFEAFLATDETRRQEGYSYRYFLWAEQRYAELLGRASGGTVLNLFLRILIELTGSIPPEEDILIGRTERVLEVSIQRNRVIRAILSGDVEIAVLEARRGAARNTAWI